MQASDRIGRRIRLQDLHILMTVVEAGSMGKAADRLHTSQPAISNSIAKLEHALGVRLLDRHSQGIEPTRHGRAFLDCGRAVFDDLRQGIKNVELLDEPTAGEVKIGCNPVIAASFVPALIDRMSRRYPRIVFHLTTALTTELYHELTNGTVDLLITRRFGPIAGARLDFEFLFGDPFVVVTGATNWAAQDSPCRFGQRDMAAASSGQRIWVSRD